MNKLTKEQLKRYYDSASMSLSYDDPVQLIENLSEDTLVNFWLEDRGEDGFQAFASLKVGNGKFEFPVLVNGDVELWDGLDFNGVYDTFKVLQDRVINLTE